MSSPTGGLKVYNSLTRSLEDFIPIDPNGKRVNWYSCGPTVYDSSHMGHARSYITFDILRRVFTNYFGYDVFYVMNVTDIDDKIIKRGRQEYLFDNYINSPKLHLSQLINDTTEAVELYVQETLKTTDTDKKQMRERILTAVKSFIQLIECEIKLNPKEIQEQKSKLTDGVKDVLLEWLDFKFLQNENKDPIGNEVFENFSRKWELEYFEDMKALNIQKPNVLTRVSEYVEEIIAFIEKIVKNGYGYETNGSVYFDVMKFKEKFKYAKLVPEAVGDIKVLDDGEGELSDNKGEKRTLADFALWKSSKVGEPSWNSPWGKGRPGWHIECSAMAGEIIGEKLDVHTGGVDLKFPHHDNEIAQCEAFYESNDWVKYFLHSGHLTIAGCKMSKSLKNFITIKQALEQYTSNQLRITFLLHSWKDTLDYSPSGMQSAIQVDKSFQEYFLNVKDALKNTTNQSKWNKEDFQVEEFLTKTKLKVHEALCNNIDTKTVVFALKDLVGFCNVYLQNSKKGLFSVNADVLEGSVNYIRYILGIFGVQQSAGSDSSRGEGNPLDEEAIILPFLEILSDFREKVRTTCRSVETIGEVKSTILKECDLIRDEKLPQVGVRLEDYEGSATVIKYIGKEALQKEMLLKSKQDEEILLEKQRKKEEQEKLQREKDAQRRIPPWELFSGEVEKYSKFDIKGIPTHDQEGNPLTKSTIKKLQKIFLAQEKKYNDYLVGLTGGKGKAEEAEKVNGDGEKEEN